MTSDREVVLVSWVSVRHKAAPLLTAIDHPKSPLYQQVRRLYLCWRDAADGGPERVALRETREELRNKLEPICPEIVTLQWETDAPPTDHTAIRPFAEKSLKRVRKENPDALVAIHLSPGTPAMHAVWLVLGTTGLIPGPVKLLQTADRRAQKAGQPPVKYLRFDLDTWLLRYRKSRPKRSSSDDTGHMWDPAEVKSGALREALTKLKEWAPLRVPVLLVGERGTGKTTLANFLRSMSPFQKSQEDGWPRVVCGQFRVNPQLARSELFGHVRGAFTGATKPRQGLLEKADGDTLFLDEIADIDRDTQRLLMAAIEGRGFQRLGDVKVQYSGFRLVCATNRSLDELRGELLDRDFFDRIAVFVLSVPPLRQCQEDLPDAWRKVLTTAVKSGGIQPDRWSHFAEHPQIIAAVKAHPLPGNFRDLQRAAFHLLAALHADRPEEQIVEVAIEALGPRVREQQQVPSPESLAGYLPRNLKEHLEAYEGSWLRAALKMAGGNQSKAAKLVGFARKTFTNRLQKTTGQT